MKKALFIYTVFSTFVQHDLKILGSKFSIHSFQFSSQKNKLKNFLLLFIFLIKHIIQCHFIYIWFASTHSLLPALLGKIFGKDVFIVLGGYDVADLPEVKYGSFSNKFRAFATRWATRLATKNIAVSNYVKQEIVRKIPRIKNKVTVVYNGIDTTIFKDLPISTKEKIILSVATVHSNRRYHIKGIDLFIELARRLPKYQFFLIGMSKTMQQSLKQKPDNLIILEKIPYKTLLSYYAKSTVYCQLSLVESFGLAVVEAMACGCIPIVTNRGALPEIVNSFGYIVDRNDLNNIVKTVSLALQNYRFSQAQKIQAYALETFDIRRREKKLLEIVSGKT